ncbi:MAG: type I methionyl aminopeptidase [Candidatus Omnitrophica bacterium]|jgi:methionyl aminopeptidase|nr:type I methionyl aminopeptidase [Candidatus Omnitrophota bacterium]
MIPIKSEAQLEALRQAGKILAQIIEVLRHETRVGVTTAQLDRLAEDLVLEKKALPAFKGYKGFPCVICASVNEEIVHGIPSERVLQEGDILSLDIGLQYRGYFSDSAITIGIGKISASRKKLIQITRNALSEGIKKAKVGAYLFDISYAIQNYVERNGFSVVRQFVGHGIGKDLHEDPEVPNFGLPKRGPVLKNGMVLAIEPMVNAGTWECRILDNGWTAVTKDGKDSAHFEHTVAITENGPQILTI